MLYTTFQRLKDASACASGYATLANYIRDTLAVTPKDYGMHRPIALATIADSNGLADTLWVLRNATFDDRDKVDKLARGLSCDFAEHVLHVFEAKYPDDKRPRYCIEVTRKWIDGVAKLDELKEARSAAYAAYAAADATYGAGAYAAACAAYAAYAAYAADAYAYAACAACAADARRLETQWQLDRVKQIVSAESDDCATTFSQGGAVGNEVAA